MAALNRSEVVCKNLPRLLGERTTKKMSTDRKFISTQQIVEVRCHFVADTIVSPLTTAPSLGALTGRTARQVADVLEHIYEPQTLSRLL